MRCTRLFLWSATLHHGVVSLCQRYKALSLPQYHAQVIICKSSLPAENFGLLFPSHELLYIYILGVGSYSEDSVLYKWIYREQEAKHKPEQLG